MLQNQLQEPRQCLPRPNPSGCDTLDIVTPFHTKIFLHPLHGTRIGQVRLVDLKDHGFRVEVHASPRKVALKLFNLVEACLVPTLPRSTYLRSVETFAIGLESKNLAEAIDAAVDAGCEVILICLGWIWAGKELRTAVARAVKRGVLVFTAAGQLNPALQGWRYVVAPARLPGTIAVASCDHLRKPSPWSFHGTRVDVTAPGDRIWRASSESKVNQCDGMSSGTSYSTAQMAGIATLWLEYWSGDPTMQATRGTSMRTTLFQKALRECGLKEPVGSDRPHHWGAGIIDVEKLLAYKLPEAKLLKSTPLHVLHDDIDEFADLMNMLNDDELSSPLVYRATRDVLAEVFKYESNSDRFIANNIESIAAHLDIVPNDAKDLAAMVRARATEDPTVRRENMTLFGKAPQELRQKLRLQPVKL